MNKSTPWGLLAKLVYKLALRKKIKEAVVSTDNTLDDKVLSVLDALAGHRGSS